MNKQIIGYTTGVFDMFHIGHLNILKNAKEKCDYLIVGVSKDELVQEYKNKKPIIPYEERAAIVESIKYVDKVVPQTSMDKREAWGKYKFNVMFHGSDWKNTDMYNQIVKELSEIGVEVVFLPYTEGISSTLLSDVLHKLSKA